MNITQDVAGGSLEKDTQQKQQQGRLPFGVLDLASVKLKKRRKSVGRKDKEPVRRGGGGLHGAIQEALATKFRRANGNGRESLGVPGTPESVDSAWWDQE